MNYICRQKQADLPSWVPGDTGSGLAFYVILTSWRTSQGHRPVPRRKKGRTEPHARSIVFPKHVKGQRDLE